MTDKPRLIDADKLLKWMFNREESRRQGTGGRSVFYQSLYSSIEDGDFDPDPPQQPDIQIGDRVQHKWIDRGVGTVMGFSECLINVQFPDVYTSCFEENLLKVEGEEV
jgi:hypothetical protein